MAWSIYLNDQVNLRHKQVTVCEPIQRSLYLCLAIAKLVRCQDVVNQFVSWRNIYFLRSYFAKIDELLLHIMGKKQTILGMDCKLNVALQNNSQVVVKNRKVGGTFQHWKFR